MKLIISNDGDLDNRQTYIINRQKNCVSPPGRRYGQTSMKITGAQQQHPFQHKWIFHTIGRLYQKRYIFMPFDLDRIYLLSSKIKSLYDLSTMFCSVYSKKLKYLLHCSFSASIVNSCLLSMASTSINVPKCSTRSK